MAAVSRYRVATVLFRRRNKLAAGRFVLVGGSGRAEGFRSRSVLVRSLSHPPAAGGRKWPTKNPPVRPSLPSGRWG